MSTSTTDGAGDAGTFSGDSARERLAGTVLCVLVEGSDPAGFERLIGDLFAAGVTMLQIRDKRLSDDELRDRCRRARAVARWHDPVRPPLVIANDHAAVAAEAADGVHLGAADMPVADARRLLGTGLIGRTAHGLAEARAAVAAGADYLGIGPCYPSATKAFARHAPREFLAAAAALPLPVFAIGGITAARIGALAELGIRRVAVASAVTAAADPAAAARTILEALRG